MATCHLKSKKGTQLLFYMAIGRNTNQSVAIIVCEDSTKGPFTAISSAAVTLPGATGGHGLKAGTFLPVSYLCLMVKGLMSPSVQLGPSIFLHRESAILVFVVHVVRTF